MRGIIDVIKYEGDSETLVWKYPLEDFNLGSQLIVHESQEAVFFKNGQALDSFRAGEHTLKTDKIPLLSSLYSIPTGGDTPFHSEIYFVNLATQMGIKWGTDSKVRLFDPASGLHVELGASGEFNIRVIDARKLLMKIVGTTNSFMQSRIMGENVSREENNQENKNQSKGYFRSMIITQVKSFLAQTIRENAINILEVDEHLMDISISLRDKINVNLAEYGLEMPEFYVGCIITPDEDKNFGKMKELHAAQHLLVRNEQIKQKEAEAASERKTVEAQTMARMKIIEAQAEAEAYRIRTEAEAAEMRLKGFTYQQQTSREVGLEAMKNGIGGAAGGAVGDIAGLGVGLGILGGVMDMTKSAVEPVAQNALKTCDESVGWDCACGTKGNTGKFCPSCGVKRPEPEAVVWICPNCGKTDNMGKFCAECGTQKED